MLGMSVWIFDDYIVSLFMVCFWFRKVNVVVAMDNGIIKMHLKISNICLNYRDDTPPTIRKTQV